MENQKLNPHQQKDLDTVIWRNNFQQQITEHLQTDPAIQEYFKNFNPVSVQQFIFSYSIQKSYWHQHGELHSQLREKHDLKWIDEASWHLEAIQQKKLFNLQCLWRAEQVQLEDIKLCVDFSPWQENVLSCPFIDPITEDDIELYREYLAQEDVELKDEILFCFYQDYNGIKQAYLSEGEAGSHYFSWYEFYDSHKGTAHLMNLPNVRGEKEAFYINLARQANPEKAAALAELKSAFSHPPGEPFIDRTGKEMLSAHVPEMLDYFVNTFEDKQTKEYYKASKWFSRNNDEKDRLDEAIELLLSANEEVPVEGHHDWKEAIHMAARRYTIHKISDMLSEAYEQYQLNISMNISFPGRRDIDPSNAAKQSVIDDILLGRKLNGEPEDLNF